MSRLQGLRAAPADEAVRSISRRYFISNGFDGTLTSIGVVAVAGLGFLVVGSLVERTLDRVVPERPT